MNIRMSVLLAGSSLLAIASISGAHAAPAAPSHQQIAAVEDVGTEEIVVTARRKAENLQDVPESLNAITSEQLQKYNIIDLSDVGKLIPGFQASFSDPTATLTLRGLSTSTGSAAPPSMVQYLNDAPVSTATLFTAMYDIGQIEVLRGPQGTLRGKIAETGALTLTTHQPDLERIGGYGQATVGSLHDVNLQAAVGFPIVEDKLAIRIAGIYNDNKGDDIGSVNSTTPPRSLTEGGRVTLKFVPSDNLNAVVSYEHENKNLQHYASGPYFGPGNGLDGPPLTVGQLETVWPTPSTSVAKIDALEGTINFTFAGQKLTYVGGFNRNNEVQQIQFNDANIANINGSAPTTSLIKDVNQDIRISSAEPLFHGVFDYVAGFFYDRLDEPVVSNAGILFFPGAFGSPAGAPVAGPPNLLFSSSEFFSVNPNVQVEQAYYANGTIHIDHATELSAGIRYSREQHHINTTVLVPGAVAAVAFPASVPAAFQPGACAGIGGTFGTTYPGICNVPFAAQNISIPADAATYHPVIYNVELSHHFNDDFMVYLRTGSSFRNGVLNLGIAAHTNADPRYAPYLLPGPEKMKDYEGGFKGDLFDKRITFDFDYFHMTYSSFMVNPAAAWFISYTGGVPTASHASIGPFDLPAHIDGVELNVAGKITDRWTASGAFSYASGQASGAGPCDPPGIGPNASPTAALAALQAAGVITETCPGLKQPTARAPKWNLNIESEYDQPITEEVTGFVRGLLQVNPSNSNTSLVGYTAPGYATLDLYIGAREPGSKWEVSVYSKNITNNRTVTDIPSSAVTSAEIGTLSQFFPGSSGYSQAIIVPPREFGITMRYAFGSR